MIIEQNKNKPIGLILWQGKSLIDNSPVVVIATGIFGKSENRKTGQVVQTYILKTDMDPIVSRRLGLDKSNCGDCKHKEKQTCYVNLCHGPLPIFKAFHNGSYREFVSGDEQYFANKSIRLGSFGDPAAVPFEVWEKLCSFSGKKFKNFVGYTHQWKTCDQRLSNFCMASVDSIDNYSKEYELAKEMGWRTFRVYGTLDKDVNFSDKLNKNEIICPASEQGGKKTICENCGLCSGNNIKAKDIMIPFHGDSPATGSNWKLRSYVKMMQAIKNKKQWRIKKYAIQNFKKHCPF